jgi:glycosyltransferase involved in cell wall biosynthesis
MVSPVKDLVKHVAPLDSTRGVSYPFAAILCANGWKLINTRLPQKSGLEATVIIPTFGRADFIIWALKSAQQQSVGNIEVFVIGDGACLETRDIVEREADKDPRIIFFENPKGEGNGERYRHQAILRSKGKIICYLGHDDLWFPEHVATMRRLLNNADFGHTLHTHIAADGTIHGLLPLISDPSCRSRMLEDQWNRFGPTCSAHTRDVYFDLPFGWRPAPLTIWSDLYMWRQFISYPGCRFAGLPQTTTISFPRSLRREYSVEQREAELADWFSRLSLPGEAERLGIAAIQSAAGDLHTEIHHLANMALENLRKLPVNQADRPLAFSRFLGRLYGLIDKLLPGKLTALKNRLMEQMIARSGLFDRQYYLDKYQGDMTAEYSDPVRHYLWAGWRIGKQPSPGFDSAFYLATHQDVLKAGINPLVHYIQYGFREKRTAIKQLDK